MDIIRKFSLKRAANIILVVLLCALIFHALILVGLIPFNIVWGGRLESVSQMYVFEAVSLVINLAIMLVVGMKAGYINPYLNGKIINAILWFLVALFLLNTVGNMVSMSALEAVIFTPLTLLSALLFYRMAIEQ